MTPWSQRMSLARQGWSTEVRLSRIGVASSAPDTVVAIGVWARRWFWHGWITDVCLHDQAVVDLAQRDGARHAARLVENVSEACGRAEAQYLEAIPCQLAHKDAEGRLVLTESIGDTLRCHGSQRGHFPTEAIPPGIEEGEDRHLEALIHAALRGLHVEDSLNPHFGRTRYMHDCKDRDWGYRVRLAVRRSAGVKVSFRPIESTTRLLAPSAAVGLTDGAQDSMLDLFDSYAPEGEMHGRTGNGLPPGFETLQESSWRRDALESEGIDAT